MIISLPLVLLLLSFFFLGWLLFYYYYYYLASTINDIKAFIFFSHSLNSRDIAGASSPISFQLVIPKDCIIHSKPSSPEFSPEQ